MFFEKSCSCIFSTMSLNAAYGQLHEEVDDVLSSPNSVEARFHKILMTIDDFSLVYLISWMLNMNKC